MGFSDFWPIFDHFSVKIDFLKRKIEKIESRQIKLQNFYEIFLHQIERIEALFLTYFFRKNFEVLFGNFRFFQLKNGQKSTNVRFRALEGSKSPENGRNEIWPFSNFSGENMGISDFWPIFDHFSTFWKGKSKKSKVAK